MGRDEAAQLWRPAALSYRANGCACPTRRRYAVIDHAALLALIEELRGQKVRLGTLLVQHRTLAQTAGSNEMEGDVAELLSRVPPQRTAQWTADLRELRETGIHTIAADEPRYPGNLAALGSPPPILFVRGSLDPADDRAVAVIGSRNASEDGLAIARRLASHLTNLQVTVVSGLALGIDTAAHMGALDNGARTIAVLGCGITRIYPPANAGLADRIAEQGQGALVSQFLPHAPPTKWSFAARNAVTSGLSRATIVIEASEGSGARIQAALCLRQGRPLLLHKRLVESEGWAAAYAQDNHRVQVIEGADDVVSYLGATDEPADEPTDEPTQMGLFP